MLAWLRSVVQRAAVLRVGRGKQVLTRACGKWWAQRIQDKVAAWVREGRWAELRDEKREVLLHMQDVLRSCHTLLQTTQIPMNGVVNLLQHILK